MRVLVHYIATAIIIPIYGVSVCPFIEGLGPFWVITPVVAGVTVQYCLRRLLMPRIVESRAVAERVGRAFKFELALFLSLAVLLALFNAVVFGFPLGSGLKVLVGISGLGFFAAIDLALAAERRVIDDVALHGGGIDPEAKYFPLSIKMGILASVSVLLIIAVIMLVVNHDLAWLVEVGDTVPISEGRRAIIVEFLFVLAVLLPHTLNIIRSYSRNIRTFFEAENRVLALTSNGDYSGRVPVCTSNEFGVMGLHTNTMVETVLARTEEVHRTRDVTILSLASLAETRDNETGAHILRTQRYIRVLVEHLKKLPQYASILDSETAEMLFKSAPLHDVGKVGIPDSILLKPGELTDEEFAIMKLHPAIGSDSLAVAQQELGSNSFLEMAREISLTHHEKWDGSGYPAGLSGTAIPISGRLMALADVYDALISKRVYKPAFSHEQTVRLITEGDGRTEPTHFDPDILKAFVAEEGAFRAIAARYTDTCD
jgi:HD-GYP domain-containing protein (c-di-GMP phosphodiesterase class II)